MLICLDIGNTHIHAGVFEGDALRFQFRKSTHPIGSSDELGVFFMAVLRENGIEPHSIDEVAICSVVPAVLYTVRSAAKKYFKKVPFVLQAGVKTGLKIRYRNPAEVGADRVANVMAARHRHPGVPLIVVDCGTATTLDVTTASGEYLGGAIIPGIGVSAEALSSRTARLPSVEIEKPKSALGRTTVESIQSGLFHGQSGAIRELCGLLSQEAFAGEKPIVIGTGGFSRLLEDAGLFDEIVPELVLEGIALAHRMNREAMTPTDSRLPE
ncbi:MAG TPA: type III pantothenate kinase [Opitutaceae bacterium]|nr:type III pantothenate kinase [Opitutaceae bacterium]